MSSDGSRTVTIGVLIILAVQVVQGVALGLYIAQSGIVPADYIFGIVFYLVLIFLVRISLSRFLAVILAILMLAEIAGALAIHLGYLYIPNQLPFVPIVDYASVAIMFFGACMTVQGTFAYRSTYA